jgi:hypothetical protein
MFSTDGKTVFYFGQKTDFDLPSFVFAPLLDCPVWEEVFAQDKRDVYVLEPQSCGGENCGGDYTGFGWGGLGVKHPATFRWLPGGYGVDDQFVYHRWHQGALQDAKPSSFRVLFCGDPKDAFVIGQDGDRTYVDGQAARAADAFDPAWHRERR